MILKQKLGAVVVGVCLISSPAMADFLFTDAGPLNSAGAIGDAGNSTVAGTGATGGIFSSLVFSGNLTEVNTATFASEARFNVTAAGYNAEFQVSTTSTFAGTLAVAATRTGAFWAPTGDYQVETYESFDDGAGTDATWDSVSLALTGAGPSIFDLGNFASGTSFLFDTEGSLFDTELGGLTGSGLFLDSDDDGGTNLLSLLDLGSLIDGEYYLALGGFNSLFGDGFAIGGAAGGDYNINLNGASVLTGMLGTGAIDLLRFTVGPMPTPEPGILMLLGFGLAGLGFARRRRS